MDFGVKLRYGNLIEYSAALAKQQMPVGAVHHKVAKAGLWRTPRAKRPITRHFNLFGGCEGNPQDVMEMGLTLAREALDRGDREYAERVLARLKRLPLENERARLMKQLKHT